MAIVKSDIAGLVLIGGQSTRMGRPKAVVELAGIPLWRRAVDSLAPHVGEVILLGDVTGFSPPSACRHFSDAPEGVGPLGGIAAGLESSGYEHHLLLAVDYPLVRSTFLELLTTDYVPAWAVCGQSSEKLEPLVAYYHRNCLSVIRTMLGEGETRTHRLFERVLSNVVPASEMAKIDPAKWSHFNVNTPADLIEAESRLRSGYPI